MDRVLTQPRPVAVIAGGARGVGLAIAEHFLVGGYRVALLEISRETLLARKKRPHEPGPVLAIARDLSDPRLVNTTIRRVAKAFGRIDALVNNAAIAIFKPELQTSLAEWLCVA